MSAYNPPIENVPIFDASLFRTTNSSTSDFLTQDEANRLYLQYPFGQGTQTIPALNVPGNLTMTGTSGTNYIQYPDGTKQYTASTGTSITPNNITIIPTTNPPTTSASNITNYYNNGASYAVNVRTPYYLIGSAGSTRRQNFVNICWDNTISPSIYQDIVIEYKHYLTPDTNSVSYPNNGRMIVFDYGTIIFSVGWLKQQYSGGTSVNGTGQTSITFAPQSRGAVANGSWSINANIQAEYLGSSSNCITLYYDNTTFSAAGYTGVATTWSSFSCDIKNNSANGSYPIDFPVWLVPNITTSP